MNKNYFEKKEKTKAIIQDVIVVLLGIGLNLFLIIKFRETIQHPLPIVGLLLLDLLIYFVFWKDLGIKLPKSKKTKFLISEIEEIKTLFSNKVTAFYRTASNEADKTNATCPKCKNTLDNVQKIREVSGNVSGSFSLGFGGVNGNSGTKGVNCCSKCGNEWKIAELGDYTTDAMQEFLSAMYDFFKKGNIPTNDPLRKFSAKALKRFLSEHNRYSSYGYNAEKLSELSVRDLKMYTNK